MPARRRNFEHPPRDQVREAHQYISNDFVPSFAIRRPVLIDPAEAKDIEKRIKRGLKKELPRTHARGYKIFNPAEWSVTLIENGRLREQMREAESKPTPRDMKLLAGLMKTLLLKKLTDLPPNLELPLGRVDRFGNGSPKKNVGVTPHGWRGLRGRYATHDEAGRVNPVGLLVAENKLCVAALVSAEGLNLNEAAAMSTLSRTPHISVLRNENGVRDHEFEEVSGIVAEYMPSEVSLGDPIIYLHARPGYKNPSELILRPQQSALASAA